MLGLITFRVLYVKYFVLNLSPFLVKITLEKERDNMWEFSTKQKIRNQTGEIEIEAKCTEEGVTQIHIDTEFSSMEHAVFISYFKEGENGGYRQHLSTYANPEGILMKFYKESDAIDFLDAFEDVIAQARKSLLKKHGVNAKNLQNWRQQVKLRDKVCAVCGSVRNLESHHVEPRSYTQSLELSLANGISLCKKHHDQYHKEHGKKRNDRLELLNWIAKQKGKKANYNDRPKDMKRLIIRQYDVTDKSEIESQHELYQFNLNKWE